MTAKYGNKKTNGYASKAEAKRGQDLSLMERAGLIKGLREQVPFEIIPAQEGERAAHYVADFMYFDNKTGLWVVEDVKSPATKKLAAYVLKRKLMLLVYGIRVREVA